MKRVKFKEGEQREFIQRVLDELNCPSLRELINRGVDVSYSTLKNYFVEARLLPEDLFRDMCHLSNIDVDSLYMEFLDGNWGKVKGGMMNRG